MEKMHYKNPEVLNHQYLVFETIVSQANGDFPGLGWGVNGHPPQKEGEGQFPGNGNGNGWHKHDAGH